jgi:hypothetical protein
MDKELVNKWFSINVDKEVADIVIRLKVRLAGRDGTFNRDFRPDINIDYDDLESQMEEIPSIFAFWSSILSEQRAQTAMLERSIKMARGKIFRALMEGDGSIPKWKVDEHIDGDDDINKLEGKLIIEKRKESKLFVIVDSLKMKSDSLRSLAGFKRQELRDADG